MDMTDPPSRKRQGLLVSVLFTLTIFLSASLLFFVQPLFAKIVLPLIGGTPAVWTTAMLFFQTVLIGGYFYAHVSTKYLPVSAQVILHICLWGIALFFLPLSVQADWQFDPDTGLAWQTLMLFAVGVGMPFAVLSANAPLIQSWYARSGGPSADDPYFLYGASNLGSLVSLLAFPLLAEPFFGARQIGMGWAAGFVALGAFLVISGFVVRNGSRNVTRAQRTASPKVSDYALWMLYAFIASSLMLAVTTKISTDLGSFPLIWILPLSLFLLTFVLTFTQRPLFTDAQLHRWFLFGMAIFAVLLSGIYPPALSVGGAAALLFGFFVIALKMHRALYNARPDETHLTIYYVTMSIGGALGGVFNAIAAPVIFVALDELRVTAVLAACVILIPLRRTMMAKDGILAVIAMSLVLLPIIFQSSMGSPSTFMFAILATYAIMMVVILIYSRRQLISFAVLAGVLVVGRFVDTPVAIFEDRSFFGAHQVIEHDTLRLYRHGTTVHGAQRISEIDGTTRPSPLYYYYSDGPMGQVFASQIGQTAEDIGIVGLGIGSLACYARPHQRWQFYEIDALVDDIARDPALFTFMSSCAGDGPTHIGDARIVLETQTDLRYDILVVDAYSSDAVPIHLSTKEAVALYRDRITDDGLIVLHISNRYYDLAGPMGRSAADLGLHARFQRYGGNTEVKGVSPSEVVIMSPDPQILAPFDATGNWDVLETDGGALWTDDYVNILSALR